MLAFFLVTIVFLYFVLTDISRSNQYRKALEEARDEAEYHGRAKQRFLSNMSHEIRTPLQSIIGYAELIRQQARPQQKDIDAIYHSSGHLMQVVNEVLDYNRIISGKFTFVNQDFNMAALLDEVVSVLRLQAEKKAISMILDYKIPGTDHVNGDPFRLKQVLYNLLGNAIKFTGAGQIALTVFAGPHEDDLQYTFTVTDTGIGLSAKDITRIFNEFEQAEAQTANHLAGTGLGLTISKALIEAQGGSIAVKSKPGQGSSFTFILRFKKARAVQQADEKQFNVNALIKRGTVWVIDDDAFILDICSAMLKHHHIVHRCFNSPHEVLAARWDDAVKYILIDIRMPGMSGMELCRLLRQKVPRDVQIYALTAQALPEERGHVLSQGFNGLLMKPFKEHDLLAIFAPQDSVAGDSLPDIEIDISRVEGMAFGDKDQINKILQRFMEDSGNDVAILTTVMKNNDHENTALVVHRIAGRTAQIGAASLAADFRLMEMELHADKQLTEGRVNRISSLITKLQALVKQLNRNYLYNDSLA